MSDRPTGRASRGHLLVVAFLAVAWTAAGCAGTPQPAPAAQAVSPTIQPDDRVNLTLYFRSETEEIPHLRPVVREVPVDEDLPRRAVELLLAGPVEEDGPHLTAPLPPSTRLTTFRVSEETALVGLSPHVVTEADAVATSPRHELLALAALANTLTEFPTIDAVELQVVADDANEDALGPGALQGFWRHWGLPTLLVRDESTIGSTGAVESLPSVERFGTVTAAVGTAARDPVTVTGLRLQDRTVCTRLLLTFAERAAQSATADVGAAVPRTRAWLEGDVLVVALENVGEYTADVPSRRLTSLAGGIEGVSVRVGVLPGMVELRVTLDAQRRFALQELSRPPRIALDIKKAPDLQADGS